MARIVVGIDGSPGADAAVRWAVAEAQLWAAELELVHGYVVEVHRSALAEAARDVAEGTMQQVLEHHREPLGDVTWSSRLVPVLGSSFAGALVRAGDDADLLVVGSRGLGGFRALLLGSTSYRTVLHATCPVAVIRTGQAPADNDVITVGVDGSRVARRALQWALDEAARRGGTVAVVHAYDAPDPALALGTYTPSQLEAARREADAEACALVDRMLGLVDVPEGVPVERVVTAGVPAREVLDHAVPGGLTVVGTRGRGALGRTVMGSVSHQVLHHAAWPVVAVP